MWLNDPVQDVNEQAREQAKSRQGILTKPPGSLGRLEDLAVMLAGLQGRENPQIEKIYIAVFAGDHGVADENVSAFPQAVTGEMVKNFARGGAAISVLAKQLNATLEVFNMGTVGELESMEGVFDRRVAAGTANMAKQPAMSDAQLQKALDAGREAAQRARDMGAELFIAGDMGIANTTAATAIACALLNLTPSQLAGPGTGLDETGVLRKVRVLDETLALHKLDPHSPLDVLRCVGGFEIAAMTGAYVACAQMGIPVLVDGFIATSAALAAVRANAGVGLWTFLSHASAEPGHKLMVQSMGADPLLDLGMRLGEGSGAAVTVPLLQMACALHNSMATFAEAGVSGKS